jgi:hypothetical protein
MTFWSSEEETGSEDLAAWLASTGSPTEAGGDFAFDGGTSYTANGPTGFGITEESAS